MLTELPRGDHSHWPISFRRAAVTSLLRALNDVALEHFENEPDLGNWGRVPHGTWETVVNDLKAKCPESERSHLPNTASEREAFGRTVRRLLHKFIQHGSVADLPHPPRPVDGGLEATLAKMYDVLMRGWEAPNVEEGWHIFHSLQEADEISPEFHTCMTELNTQSYKVVWRLLKKRHPSLGYLKIRYKAARCKDRSCTGAKQVLGEEDAPLPPAYTNKHCKFADIFKNRRYRYDIACLQHSISGAKVHSHAIYMRLWQHHREGGNGYRHRVDCLQMAA